jgi:hypothetical protein
MLYPKYGGSSFLRNVANDLLDWTESCQSLENPKSHVIFGFLSLCFLDFLAIRVVGHPVICAIRCFRRGVNVIFALLGCYAASIGRLLRLLDPKHACPEAKDSNPTTGLNLICDRNPFRGNSNYWQVSLEEAGRIIPKRRKPEETIRETSRRVRPEWDKKVAQLHVR